MVKFHRRSSDGQVDRLVPEAVAHGCGNHLPAGQRPVGQGKVQVVADRRREQRLDRRQRNPSSGQPVVVAGGMLGEVVDHIQVFAQVGSEGQRMRKGAEVIDPLQVVGRDQGGEAVRLGFEAVRQAQEAAFEEGDQPAEQRSQGEDACGFLAHLAALSRTGIGSLW